MTVPSGVSVDDLVAAIWAAHEASRPVARALVRLDKWSEKMVQRSAAAAVEADEIAERVINFQADMLADVSHAMDASAVYGNSPLGDLDDTAAGARAGLAAFAESARTATANLLALRETVEVVGVWIDVAERQLRSNRRSALQLKEDPGLRTAIERCQALAESLRELIKAQPAGFRHAAGKSAWGPLAEASESLVGALYVAAGTAETLTAALRAASGS